MIAHHDHDHDGWPHSHTPGVPDGHHEEIGTLRPSGVIRIGIGGPVGSGKTALIEALVPRLIARGHHPLVVTNDIFTSEDAEHVRATLAGTLDPERVVGVETGSCPHAAVRDDPSMNLDAVTELGGRFPDADLVLVESGGDNLTLTFSRALADYFIFVIDVAQGDKIPRKRGPGVTHSDLLVINKIDLAPYVRADLDGMRRDARAVRGERPFVLTNCYTGEGLSDVVERVQGVISEHPAYRGKPGMNETPVRRDLAWCSPTGLPHEILAFDNCLEGGLPVGAPGKLGVLDLTLSTAGGRTRVERQFQRAPLYIFRPVYLDPVQPDMAFIFMQQSGDGLVQGDRYRIDISCRRGSATHITTQAATKIFAARQNFASQIVNLRADEGTILEYLPDPIVPFRGSRFFQRTSLTAHPGSTVILGETLLPGRVARGEKHLYDLYWAETDVRDSTGDLLFSDVLRLNPATGPNPNSEALLGEYDVIAALYIINLHINSKKLQELLRATLAGCPDVLAGVSDLPNSCGVAVRLLGPTSAKVQAAVAAAWTTARLELLGAPAPNLRKG